MSRALIKSPVNVYQGGGFVTMTQSHGTMVFSQKQQLSPTSDQGSKVPRPPNAFILYRQHHHPVIKGLHPDFHNNQICKSTKQLTCDLRLILHEAIVLGQQWKNESAATKEHFIRLSRQLKEKHIREHPQYAYQPRKPGDKKRRMTPKKAAKLHAMAGSLLRPDDGASHSSHTASGSVYIDGIHSHDDFEVELVDEELADEDPTIPALLPDFATTDNGNLRFVLGDSSISPKTFEAMLNKQNDLNLKKIVQANIPVGTPLNAPGININNIPSVIAFNDHNTVPIVSRSHDESVECDYLFNANATNWGQIDTSCKDIDNSWESQFFMMDLAAAEENRQDDGPDPYAEIDRQESLNGLFGFND